ncbi:MAG: ArsR/SmtB family transcription factor [Armatimonadota bacterium]
MSEQLTMEWTGVETCDVFCSDEHKVRRLREHVGQAVGLGSLFKAFSDETRAKILYCLLHDELCVCDVSQILGMSVQAVSHHLRLLKTMRIVKSRRDGKMVFYSLDDAHIAALIHNGLAHIHEEER